MSKKRLAIWLPGGIGGGYFSQGIPTISSLVSSLANHFEITVYSLHSPNPEFIATHFRVVSLKFPAWKSARWLLLMLRFVNDHLKNRFFAVYSFWGFPSGFIITVLGKIFSIPSIVHLQGGDSVGIPSIHYGIFVNRFFKSLAIWTYQTCTRLVTLTSFQSHNLRNYGVHRPVDIIPFGVNTTQFHFHGFSFDGQRELRILHVANITPVKDQRSLLKMFSLLVSRVPAKLTMVGMHATGNEITRLCNELRVEEHVDRYELQPYEQLSKFYAQADVFVLTSLYEGQGIVLAEAAASGCLLAGTNVGLLNDLGQGCVTVEPGKYHELAEAILNTAYDHEKSRTLTECAYAWALLHDHNWTVLKIITLLDELGGND